MSEGNLDADSFLGVPEDVGDPLANMNIRGGGTIVVHGSGANWTITTDGSEGDVADIADDDDAPFQLGFALRGADASSAYVRPSVVTGLETVHMPVIGSTPLDEDPAPSISISGTKTVYLRIEIACIGKLIVNSDPTAYEIDEGYTTLTGDITVTTDKTGETLPAINTSTGANTTPGVWYIPLGAMTQNDNPARIVVLSQWIYGPTAVRLCSTGILAIVPPVIIHTGTIDQLEAPIP